MSGETRAPSAWRSVKRDVILHTSLATPWTNVVGVKEASYNACDLWVRGPETYKDVHFRVWAVNGPIEVLVYEGQIGLASGLRILPDGAITAIIASVRDRPCDGFRVEAQRGSVEHEVGHWRLEAGWKDGPQGDRGNRVQVEPFCPLERHRLYSACISGIGIFAPPQFVAIPNRRLNLTNITITSHLGPSTQLEVRNMLGAFPQAPTRFYRVSLQGPVCDHFSSPWRGEIGAAWDIDILNASTVDISLGGYVE